MNKHNTPTLRFAEFTDEWQEKRLGNIYKFLQTNSFSRALLNYENGHIKNIHYGDIHTKYKLLFDIDNENVPYINNDIEIERIAEENYCKVGDIVMVDASEDYAGVGEAIEIINLDNQKMLAGLHTFLIRPKVNIALGFAIYLMKSFKVRFQLMQKSTGFKVSSISKPNLSNIILYLPADTREQQKIAVFLSLVDDKIALLQRKKSGLENYKKSMMQQLFPHEGETMPTLRFPNFTDKWQEKRIDEVFTITRGNVLSTTKIKVQKDGIYKYKVYSSQTKNNGLLGYYNEYLYENSLTWTTDGANAGDVNYRQGMFYCTNVCGVLLNDEGYANECVASILNRVTRQYVSYVGNPKLMNNVMGKIKISLPSLPEQQKIAEFLSALDASIDAVTAQLTQAENFKKYLMQNMFV